MELPQVDPIRAAIARLCEQLGQVATESLPISEVAGRVLAEPLCADRDSPPLDVSAMDGYAVCLDDLSGKPLAVSATAAAGGPAPPWRQGTAMRVFTGAPVPPEANCVIRREDTHESELEISLALPADEVMPGQHIRRRGENVRQGTEVLPRGTLLRTGTMAALASFGPPRIDVHRRVRVAILNTGDELVPPGAQAERWRIRDSNGPLLESWLKQAAWVELVRRRQVADRMESVVEALEQSLHDCDALLMTGGVSMGDADYVPSAIEQLGGTIAFHRLPLRPGKPVLGAAIDGKLLLGLPGNPVSVAVTSRVFGWPLLLKLAGVVPNPHYPQVQLTDPDDKQLDLTWFRLVYFDGQGDLKLVPTLGSGDVVSLGHSDGVVEVPPGGSGPGPWPLILW